MSVFPDRMWVNDRSLAEFKVLTSDPKGFMAPPQVSDQRISIPGRLGQLRVSGTGESPPRRVTVNGIMRADTDAECITLWDALLLLLADEEVELRFDRWPDRVGYARTESAEPVDSPLRRGTAFTLGFVMDDPLKYAREFDVYTVANGAEVPLVLGSAPSDLHLRLIGTGASLPTVYYKDAQGTIRGDLTFDVPEELGGPNLLAGEWIDWNWWESPIGSGHQLALHYSLAGVVTDVSPTGSHFPVADPADGDATTGPSLLAVNCDVIAEVFKAWR